MLSHSPSFAKSYREKKQDETKIQTQTEIYEAENPYPEKPYSFSLINYSFANASAASVLPALTFPKSHDDQIAILIKEATARHGSVKIERRFIKTYDDAYIDTYSATSIEFSGKPVIIKFNGNGVLYEHRIHEIAQEANDFKAWVIGFNYRAVSPAKLLGVSSTTGGIFNFLLNRGQWNRDVTKDFLSIPRENRIHFYVDHKAGCGDGVIPHAASLHQALENHENTKKVKKEDKEKKVEKENGHKLFSRKLTKEVGGHCLSRYDLVEEESGKTQHELYSEFVTKSAR